MSKRVKTKGPDLEALKSKIENLEAAPKPAEDGEAKTAAEPVPEPKRGRGRPKGSKTKKPAAEPGDFNLLDPELAKVAALAPHMLAAGIAARFFDTALVYDPAKLAASERMFVRWMDELQIKLGPGWQYGALTAVCIGQGIMASEPITPEMREAAKKAMEEAKAKARAEAQAAANAQAKREANTQANGATAPAQSAGVDSGAALEA